MKLKVLILTAVLLIATLLAVAALYRPVNQLTPVRVAVSKWASSALPIIAQQKDFFADRGLAVDFQYYSTGADCIDAIVSDRADIAAAYITPLALAISKGAKLEVLTQLHTAHDNTIFVYRKDRGIHRPEDLVGKRIGYVRNSNAQYFLQMFLNLHFLDPVDVIHSHLKPTELISSLEKGSVDAIIYWQPNAAAFVEANAESYSIFTSEVYSDYSAAVASENFILEKPAVIRSFLLALGDALEFYERDRVAAQKLIFTSVDLPHTSETERVWNRIRIHMGLSHIFHTMLGEELAWAERLQANASSNHGEYIRSNFLRELYPEKVLIK